MEFSHSSLILQDLNYLRFERDKTTQDETRQDKTSRDETRQDETR